MVYIQNLNQDIKQRDVFYQPINNRVESLIVSHYDLHSSVVSFAIFFFPNLSFIERFPIQKIYHEFGPNCMKIQMRLLDDFSPTKFRAAMAGKAPNAWALSRFWVSIHSFIRNNRSKKFGVEYRALPGTNSPWRP